MSFVENEEGVKELIKTLVGELPEVGKGYDLMIKRHIQKDNNLVIKNDADDEYKACFVGLVCKISPNSSEFSRMLCKVGDWVIYRNLHAQWIERKLFLNDMFYFIKGLDIVQVIENPDDGYIQKKESLS